MAEKKYVRTWENQFGEDGRPPPEILRLVELGILEDTSWNNDAAPSFEWKDRIRVWSAEANPVMREIGGSCRYAINTIEPDSLVPLTHVLETDNIEVILKYLSDAGVPIPPGPLVPTGVTVQMLTTLDFAVLPRGTFEQAKDFLKSCIDHIGIGFHPDNSFDDYVDDDGRRSINFECCPELERSLAEAINLFIENDQDIYEYCMSLLRPKLDGMVVGKDGPTPAQAALIWGFSHYGQRVKLKGSHLVGRAEIDLKDEPGVIVSADLQGVFILLERLHSVFDEWGNQVHLHVDNYPDGTPKTQILAEAVELLPPLPRRKK